MSRAEKRRGARLSVVQALYEMEVGGRGVVGLAFLQLEVRADGFRLGANVALNLHARDHSAGSGRGRPALGMRRCAERQDCRNDENRPTKNQTYPRHLHATCRPSCRTAFSYPGNTDFATPLSPESAENSALFPQAQWLS